MAIDYQRLKSRAFPPITQAYEPKDSILYALGIGLGQAPCDRDELRFVYEKRLAVLPTMATVLATPGFWLSEPDTGVDWTKVLHGEQGLELHRPLPCEGTVKGETRIDDIIDKGPGRGALIYWSRDIRDAATGVSYATVTGTAFCRADGGFGGPDGPVRSPHRLPDREPDQVVTRPTLPLQALLYRLSGDFNPLHADPDVALAGGFERPILHGLCTYGIAGHAIIQALCGHNPDRLKRLDARFSSPVYPGDTLITEIWLEAPGQAGFRCRTKERGNLVLDCGYAVFSNDEGH